MRLKRRHPRKWKWDSTGAAVALIFLAFVIAVVVFEGCSASPAAPSVSPSPPIVSQLLVNVSPLLGDRTVLISVGALRDDGRPAEGTVTLWASAGRLDPPEVRLRGGQAEARLRDPVEGQPTTIRVTLGALEETRTVTPVWPFPEPPPPIAGYEPPPAPPVPPGPSPDQLPHLTLRVVPDRAPTGSSFIFEAVITGFRPVLYRWDLDGDGTVDRETLTQTLVAPIGTAPGHYFPRLTIEAEGGSVYAAVGNPIVMF